MKLLLKIKDTHLNDGLRMLEVDGLTVTKVKETSKNRDGYTYDCGYKIVIKNIINNETYLSISHESFSPPSSSRLKELNNKCNEDIERVIGLIQEAITTAKKRHSEFTNIVEL